MLDQVSNPSREKLGHILIIWKSEALDGGFASIDDKRIMVEQRRVELLASALRIGLSAKT